MPVPLWLALLVGWCVLARWGLRRIDRVEVWPENVDWRKVC